MGRSVRSVMAIVVAALALPALAVAQEAVTITGRVTSVDGGAPLNSASVTVEGLNAVALTRDDGRYTLVIPAARAHGQTAQIVARLIGYQAKAATIVLRGNITQDFALPANPLRLGEVVVTGLGLTSTTEKLGTAVSTVDSTLITKSHETNVVEALAGKSPGVLVNSQSGDPGAASYIRIRGIKSLSGNAQPLFVVDGVPIDNSTMTAENALGGVVAPNRASDINPNDIEDVTILKGAAAAAVYGARAADGVVLITTKSGHAGGTHYNMSTNYSFDNVNKKIPLQTDYAQGSHGVTATCGAPGCHPSSSSWGALIPEGTPTYNHFDELFDTGHTSDNVLSASGGNERPCSICLAATRTRTASSSVRQQLVQARDGSPEGLASALRSLHRRREFLVRRHAWPVHSERLERVGADARRDAHAADLQQSPVPRQHDEDCSGRIAFRIRARSTTRRPRLRQPVLRRSTGPEYERATDRTIGNLNVDYQATRLAEDQLHAGRATTTTTAARRATRSVVRAIPRTVTCSAHDGEQPADRSQPDGDGEPHVQPTTSRERSRSARTSTRAGSARLSVTGSDAHRTAAVRSQQHDVAGIPNESSRTIHTESYFGQATADLFNQLYLTAAMRNDGFSTFGAGNPRAWYPKASVAWTFTNALGKHGSEGAVQLRQAARRRTARRARSPASTRPTRCSSGRPVRHRLRRWTERNAAGQWWSLLEPAFGAQLAGSGALGNNNIRPSVKRNSKAARISASSIRRSISR